MSTTAAVVPEVGAVYDSPTGNRVRVVSIGEGTHAGQVLVEFALPGRFAGQRWWWFGADLADWTPVPRGWDRAG